MSGVNELYTQTWSGNVRMLRCAEKLGFVECNRGVGTREVDGQRYDGLTFRIQKCSPAMKPTDRHKKPDAYRKRGAFPMGASIIDGEV